MNYLFKLFLSLFVLPLLFLRVNYLLLKSWLLATFGKEDTI